MFEAFECNNLNLIAKLFGVVSPHGFDMGNTDLMLSIKKIDAKSAIQIAQKKDVVDNQRKETTKCLTD